MNTKSIDALKSDVNQIKSALQVPSLYVYHHFDELKNEIDIACQRKLESQNNETKHLEDQELIIKEVQAFEKACMSSLVDGQFESELFESLTASISQIEESLANVVPSELIGISKIQEQISETFFTIQKRVFLNRTMKFLTNESSFVKESAFSVSQCLLGSLVVIEDEYVADEYFSYCE